MINCRAKGNTINTTGVNSTPDHTLSKAFMCPSAVVQAGYLHSSSNPIAMGQKDEFKLHPGIPHLKISQLSPSARIVMVLDGVQHSTNGNTRAVGFMADSGIPFWARFGTSGISDNQRYRVHKHQGNIDSTGTPPRGRFRWRHGSNNAINTVFADGHGETFQYGALTNNSFFPDGWKSKQ